VSPVRDGTLLAVRSFVSPLKGLGILIDSFSRAHAPGYDYAALRTLMHDCIKEKSNRQCEQQRINPIQHSAMTRQ